MSDIVITAAKRTPVGSFLGAYATTPAHVLGQTAIIAALEQAGIAPDEVDEVILGHVLTAGLGQNPARQAAVAAGIPVDRTAFAINQVCGSGLRAVALAAQAIANGDASIMVAGGQENMSLSPHAQFLRAGQKMGNLSLVDTMIQDGLTDAFNGYHMGITAENLAEKYQITREEQDAFAVGSQNKASAARASGRFKDEIAAVTVKGRKGDTIVENDEYIRDGATIEAMEKLKPAFKKDGTVTAGNASGVNDGACAVLLASESAAAKHGLRPRARVLAMATVGLAPRIMGFGPAPATRKVLAMAGLRLSQIDVVELNEAFAAQALAVTRDLGLADDAAHVNANGGAIAIGHPLGASGARLVTTALNQLERTGGRHALCTMCIGVGQGIALVIERV